MSTASSRSEVTVMKGLIRSDIRFTPDHLIAGVLVAALSGGACGYALARARVRRQYDERLEAAVAEVKAHYNRPILPQPPGPAGLVINLPRVSRTWKETVAETLNGPQPATGERNDEPSAAPSDERPAPVRKGRSKRPKPDEPGGENHEGSVGGGTATGAGIPAVPAAADEAVDPTEGLAEAEAAQPEEEPDDTGSIRAITEVIDPADIPETPHEISVDDFGELIPQGWQCISITYYAADKVLVDDKEQPIRDAIGTVGLLAPELFGLKSGNPHIRFVRNRRLEVDFEIALNAGSYAETVLGYGQPARRRTAPARPASTRK
jgi:hypothetical protein